MDKKLKAKWVKALESGRYKQGKKRLAGGGYYCCLGVLRKIDPSIEAVFAEGSLVVKSCHIPESKQYELIRMNDGETHDYPTNKSFKEIAAWIRSHL